MILFNFLLSYYLMVFHIKFYMSISLFFLNYILQNLIKVSWPKINHQFDSFEKLSTIILAFIILL